MAQDVAQEKQQLHAMVDLLAPEQVHTLRGLIKEMLDPVARAIANAPMDDEPLTSEDEKALDQAREWLKHHQGIPHERVLAELGLTREEVDNYQEPA